MLGTPNRHQCVHTSVLSVPRIPAPIPHAKSACSCPPGPRTVQLPGPCRGSGRTSSLRPAGLAGSPSFSQSPAPAGPAEPGALHLPAVGRRAPFAARAAEPRGGAAARRASPCPQASPCSWPPTPRGSGCGHPASRPAPVGTSCRPAPPPAPPAFPEPTLPAAPPPVPRLALS